MTIALATRMTTKSFALGDSRWFNTITFLRQRISKVHFMGRVLQSHVLLEFAETSTLPAQVGIGGRQGVG